MMGYLQRVAAKNLIQDALSFMLITGITLWYLWPAPKSFSTQVIGGGDAWQTVWNFWWLDRCLLHEAEYPFYTPMLFHPQGAYLYFHTHGFLNALLALPIIETAGLIPAYNSLVIFTFLSAGFLTYILIRKKTGDCLAAFLAAFMFSMSPYRIHHATGHLNLLSTEWFPLTALVVPWALRSKLWRKSFAAGVMVALIPFTDYYYFIYMLILSFALILSETLAHREWPLRRRVLSRGMVILSVGIGLISPYVLTMLQNARANPVSEGHDPLHFSAEFLSFIVPGPMSILGTHFEAHRSSWQGEPIEQENYLGLGALALFAYGALKVRTKQTLVWRVLVCGGVLLALGPVLHFNGKGYDCKVLPYSLLSAVIPLDLGGVPSRFVTLALFALAVLAGYSVAHIRTHISRRFGTVVGVVAVAATLLETAPVSFPTQELHIPSFYYQLGQEPETYAILDNQSMLAAMYCQTAHGKPIVGGYLSRNPIVGMDFMLRTPVIRDLLFGTVELALSLERVDEQITFNWGEDSPSAELLRDRFHVTWGGELNFPNPGVYTIRTLTDDGVRLWLNGNLLIDDWEDQPPTWNEIQVPIETPGWQPIAIEYAEELGMAVCELHWEGPGLEPQPIPKRYLRTPEGTEGLLGKYYNRRKSIRGWKPLVGEYFMLPGMGPSIQAEYVADNGTVLGQPRTWVPVLDASYQTAAEASPIVVRWTGTLYPPLNGLYTFAVENQAFIRLAIDGRTVLLQNHKQLTDGYDGTIELTTGAHSFLLELKWHGEPADLAVWWLLPEFDGKEVLCQYGIKYLCTEEIADWLLIENELGLPLIAEEYRWRLYQVDCQSSAKSE